jgi:Glycosyltransferase WbsX
VQFPPHNQRDLVEKPQAELSPGFRGKVFQYPQIVANALNQAAVPHRRYPGAMLAWDNTARRGDDAHIYADYEPGAFELWLEHCAQQARAQCPEGERYVFINAWNEWSEGSYLEPDHRWGRAALEAVRAVVNGQAGPQTHLALLRHRLADHAESLQALEALASRFAGLKQSLDYSLFLSRSRHPQHLPSRVFDRPPPGLSGTQTAGSGHIERLGHSRVTAFAQVAQGAVLTLSGWALPDDRDLHEGSLSFVLLRPERTSGSADSDPQGAAWYAWVNQRHRRPDVHASSGQSEARSLWSGWSAEVMLAGLPPGRYGLSLAFPCESLGSSEPATEIALRSCLEVLP